MEGRSVTVGGSNRRGRPITRGQVSSVPVTLHNPRPSLARHYNEYVTVNPSTINTSNPPHTHNQQQSTSVDFDRTKIEHEHKEQEITMDQIRPLVVDATSHGHGHGRTQSEGAAMPLRIEHDHPRLPRPSSHNQLQSVSEQIRPVVLRAHRSQKWRPQVVSGTSREQLDLHCRACGRCTCATCRTPTALCTNTCCYCTQTQDNCCTTGCMRNTLFCGICCCCADDNHERQPDHFRTARTNHNCITRLASCLCLCLLVPVHWLWCPIRLCVQGLANLCTIYSMRGCACADVTPQPSQHTCENLTQLFSNI